jgi:hypothetical protein
VCVAGWNGTGPRLEGEADQGYQVCMLCGSAHLSSSAPTIALYDREKERERERGEERERERERERDRYSDQDFSHGRGDGPSVFQRFCFELDFFLVPRHSLHGNLKLLRAADSVRGGSGLSTSCLFGQQRGETDRSERRNSTLCC